MKPKVVQQLRSWSCFKHKG